MSPAPAMPASHELRRQLAERWALRTVTSHPWSPRPRPDLARKTACTLSFCSMDHCLVVDDEVLRAAAALAAEREGGSGRSADDVMDDIRDALRRARDSQWSWEPDLAPPLPFTGLLQKIVVKLAHPGGSAGDAARDGKLRLGNEPGALALHLDLIDFLGELYRRCKKRDLRVGGAAALMAQALTRVCAPGKIALWPAFFSPAQAQLFPAEVHCLHLAAGRVHTRPARESGRPEDPESHSFPFEHGSGPLSGELQELSPPEDGRIIVSAPPLFFDAAGRVQRTPSRTIEPIQRLFAPAAGGHVRVVGEQWKSWLLTGLQGIKGQAQAAFGEDLALIPPDVTLHVEITGTGVTPWLVRTLQQHVDSLGIGDDELPGFAEGVRGSLPRPFPHPAPASGAPADGAWVLPLFERAAWLAEVLDLDRLYVHGHVVDLVIRRDARTLAPAGAEGEMEQELAGTLFAKGDVVEQAAGALPRGSVAQSALGLRPAAEPGWGPASRDVPLPLALWAMALLADRWGVLPTREGRSAADRLATPAAASAALRRGWFRAWVPGSDGGRTCMVVVVPVVWFLQTPDRPLRTTGLGDITSALSFYFGDYAVDPRASKRGRRVAAD